MERPGIATRQVGASGRQAQQRVAGQHAVREGETDRVVGVPWRVQHAKPELPGDQRLAVVDPHADVGRAAGAVHDGGHAEALRQLARGGEVVGVGVRVDQVVEAEPGPGRERQVAVDLAQLGVDEHGAARLGAPDQVRHAAAGADLLEEHGPGFSDPGAPAVNGAAPPTRAPPAPAGGRRRARRRTGPPTRRWPRPAPDRASRGRPDPDRVRGPAPA